MNYRQKAISLYGESCQRCSSEATPVLHFIDGDRTNGDEENLLLLCSNCHRKTHRGIDDFEDLYTQLPHPSRLTRTDGQRTSIPCTSAIADKLRLLKPDHVTWDYYLMALIEAYYVPERATMRTGYDEDDRERLFKLGSAVDDLTDRLDELDVPDEDTSGVSD